MPVNDIEIVSWVKFNKPGIKKEVEKLAKESTTKMQFVSAVKEKFNIGITDASIVSDNFFKKEV